MRLKIVTPLEVAVDAEIASLKAEEEDGSFGVLPGHADFLTTLPISVVSWTDAEGKQGHCAVRRGVLSVEGGNQVTVTSREAVPGDDLDELAQTVLSKFRTEIETERKEHVDSTRLQLAAIRQIMQRLRRPDIGGIGGGR